MRTLFKLVGEITITGIDLVNKQFSNIDKEAKKLERSINRLGVNMEKTGKALSKSITAPLLAIGGAMLVAANKTGKYAHDLIDLTDITGLSTKSLQELEHVARVGGVEFEGFTNTITFFTRKLPEIVKEGGKAYKSIKSLGINILDANGNIRDMNQLFPEMLKALMNVQNITERNALATTIFGRSLDNLAPVLGMTAEGFDAAVKEAHDLNLVIGDEGLKTASDYHIGIKKLTAEFTNFWRRLAIDFIPIIKDSIIPLMRDTLVPVFTKVIDVVKDVSNWFKGLTEEQKNFIIETIAVIAAYGPLLVIIGKGITITKSLTTAILLMNSALLANPFVLAGVAVASFILILKGIKDAYEDNIKIHQEWKAITVEQAEINAFTESVDALKDKIKTYGDQLKSTEDAEKLLGKDFEETTKKARALGYTVEGNLQQKLTRLIDVADTLKGGVIKLNGAVVSATKGEEDSAKVKQKNLLVDDKQIETDKKLINLKKELIQQNIANTDDIKEQYFLKLKLLQMERDEEIEQVKGNKEQIALINEIYNKKELEEKTKLTDKLLDLKFKELENEKSINDEKMQAEIDNSKEMYRQYEERKATTEQEMEERRNAFMYLAQAASEGLMLVSQLWDNYYQSQFNKLDLQQQKEIDAVNKSTQNEKIKKAQIDAINKKYAVEQSKLKKEQAKKDKAFAIFQAIINTAMGITNAYQLTPTWLAIAMSVVMGVLGAIQIAAIASEPLPAAKGAFIKGRKGGIQAQIGEGEQDELILPMKTGVAALADALMNKLSEIEAPAIERPRLTYANEGAGYTSPVMNSKREVHLHVGTLVADDAGLKQLERTLYQFRVSDEMRKGRVS